MVGSVQDPPVPSNMSRWSLVTQLTLFATVAPAKEPLKSGTAPSFATLVRLLDQLFKSILSRMTDTNCISSWEFASSAAVRLAVLEGWSASSPRAKCQGEHVTVDCQPGRIGAIRRDITVASEDAIIGINLIVIRRW